VEVVVVAARLKLVSETYPGEGKSHC
jgi:hypothetical protein